MPLFKKAKPDSAGFFPAVSAADVHENEMTAVKIAGKKVILTRWEGKLLAFDAQCPHGAADLSCGEMHRGRIICPDHEYKFDVTNGRILYPTDENYRLKRYAVKEGAGQVWVQL